MQGADQMLSHLKKSSNIPILDEEIKAQGEVAHCLRRHILLAANLGLGASGDSDEKISFSSIICPLASDVQIHPMKLCLDALTPKKVNYSYPSLSMGIGSRTLVDIKIHGCSSPLCKMA